MSNMITLGEVLIATDRSEIAPHRQKQIDELKAAYIYVIDIIDGIRGDKRPAQLQQAIDLAHQSCLLAVDHLEYLGSLGSGSEYG